MRARALLHAMLLALTAHAGLALAAPTSPDEELAALLRDVRAGQPQS